MLQWILTGGQCCQCDVSKHARESIDVSATFDEDARIGKFDVQKEVVLKPINMQRGTKEETKTVESATQDGHKGSSGEVAPSEASTQSADDGNRSDVTETPPRSNSSGSPRMNEEECTAEKARLNALAKAFTKESLVGVDCSLLQKSGGGGNASHEYTPAKFFLDKAMANMVIRGSGNKMVGSGKKMKIPLIDVVEAYLYEDLTDHVPDSQLHNNLREEDRDRAVFIQHQASGFSESWICLVLADTATQERFATGFNILRLLRGLYAEANKNNTRSY